MRIRRHLQIALCLFSFPAVALADSQGQTGGSGIGSSAEVVMLAQITLLMLIGRGLGELMQRLGQPAIIGQLVAGLILGPSLFGWIWPHGHDLIFPKGSEQKSLISGLANIGVMMLLLLTGMETDLKLVRKVGRSAVFITATGVAVPFVCGFTLGEFLPASILPSAGGRLVASLFLGTALAISSIKIVAMVVREMNFMRRNLGQIIVSSAIMEDTVGWVLISITLGIAGAGGIAVGSLAKTVIGTLLFLVFSYTAGRWLVFQLIRWVNDRFVSEYAVVTAILIVMCVMALTTQALGVNTVLGAFVAGVLIGQSPILSQQIQDNLRGFITAFMMPIFFGLSGLSADLTILRDPNLLMLTIGLVAIASIGKFAGAFAGGRIGGLSGRESLAVGCAMNARGSTEVIVASIGLSMGALTQNLYSMIVAMAVITTMSMPPMLRWALNRLPVNRAEQERLEKEALDAKGFVSRFERLLAVADQSASGKLTARLSGTLAGRRGMPVTVLRTGAKAKAGSDDDDLKKILQKAAEASGRAVKSDESAPQKPDVSVRPESENVTLAVTEEGSKGYDLLLIGMNRMVATNGVFSSAINEMSTSFKGPLALIIAGQRGEEIVNAKGFNILVPFNGTDAARRGAEFAFALSPPKESNVTALHVASRQSARAQTGAAGQRATVNRRTKKAVSLDLNELGARYGYHDVRTAIHTDVTPDAAILAEAREMGADLIVIGTTRRVGDVLSLGETVTNVLQDWKGAIILVVTAPETVAPPPAS